MEAQLSQELNAAVRLLLDTLRNHQLDAEDHEAAINDPNLPIDVLQQAISGLDPPARLSALASCTKELLLETWGAEGSARERAIVAFNPHTPAKLVRQLASDADAHVRMQVCFNPNAEPDVLAQLVLDPSPEVQDAVACAFDTDTGHHLRRGLRAAIHDPSDHD